MWTRVYLSKGKGCSNGEHRFKTKRKLYSGENKKDKV